MKWVTPSRNVYRLTVAPGYTYNLRFWEGTRDDPAGWCVSGRGIATYHDTPDAPDPTDPPWEWVNGVVKRAVCEEARKSLSEAVRMVADAGEALKNIS